MKFYLLSIFFISSLVASASFGQEGSKAPEMQDHQHIRKFYVGSALDAGIFSTATLQRQGMPNTLGTLRFSYILNTGITFNYNLGDHLGIYTGIDVKNIGFIEKEGDYTIKRRTYNLGVPLGIKIGNMGAKRGCLFLGAGVDAPFNYKEKSFTSRNNKKKFNEWFSDRTPALMPYVFAGIKFRSTFTLKFQYYLNNFLNPDFSETSGGVVVQPYAGYNVHLILLSLGVDVRYGKKNKDIVKKSVSGVKLL